MIAAYALPIVVPQSEPHALGDGRMKRATAEQLLIGAMVFIAVQVVAASTHHASAPAPMTANTRLPRDVPVRAHRPPATTPAHPSVPPLPNLSPWRTKVTGCTDSGVTGTITNTGKIVNTYIIEVSDDSGSFELGTGNTEVVNLAPGATTTWSSPVTFSNPPTGPVSCSVNDVMANY